MTDLPLKEIFFEKLTDVNFVYFMYPIKIIQFLEKNLESGSQDTRLHHFWTIWTNWSRVFFWRGGIVYCYSCQFDVPHHTKKFKLKKSLQRIRISKVLQFLSKLGPNCRVFLLGQRIGRSPALAKNLVILSPNTRKSLPLSKLPQQMFILLR